MRNGVEHLFGRLLLVANVAAAIAACLVALLVWAAPEAMSSADGRQPGVLRIDVRAGGHGMVAFCAALLLIGDVLWLAWGLAPRSPQSSVVSMTGAGPVRIAREALEAGLRAAGEALPDVSRLRVQVTARSRARRVDVLAVFQAREGAGLDRVSTELRRVVQERFAQLVTLPGGSRLHVELEFGGFLGRAAKQAEPVPQKDEEPTPFTGPRYPIDEDG